MQQNKNNYAFIDGQNLYLGVEHLGWSLDYGRFRVYLREKYSIAKAYLFIGYLPEQKNLYRALQDDGYFLIFKPVLLRKQNGVKGNVDAELVLQAMIDYETYEKALIVTGDGDFYCLVKYLFEQKKFLRILVPNRYKYSILLRRAFPGAPSIAFMNDLRALLEYRKHKTPPAMPVVLSGGST